MFNGFIALILVNIFMFSFVYLLGIYIDKNMWND